MKTIEMNGNADKAKQEKERKEEIKSQLQILFGIFTIVIGLLTILTPIIKNDEFNNITNHIILKSFISILIFSIYFGLITYFFIIIINFALLLYKFNNGNLMNESFDNILLLEIFSFPIRSLGLTLVLLTAIFTVFLLVIKFAHLLIDILQYLSCLLFIIFTLTDKNSFIYCCKKLVEFSKSKFIIIMILFSIIIFVIIISILFFYIIGFHIIYDQNFYYLNDSVNGIIEPEGLGSVNITNVDYSNNSIQLFGGDYKKKSFYIDSTLINSSNSQPIIEVTYNFRIFTNFKITKQELIPYFNTPNPNKIPIELTIEINKNCSG